jgi:Peptidase propeptide and YPEB domain
MRRTLNIGIGLGTAAIVATMAAGVASATTGGHHQAAGPAAAAVSSVNRHITRAQARQIARAKVPHSRVIETQSDDRHDRAVWKVELRTRRGQVVVDVDKRTGHAAVVRRDGGGHDDAIAASRIASAGWRGEPGDDRADVIAADHGRDAGAKTAPARSAVTGTTATAVTTTAVTGTITIVATTEQAVSQRPLAGAVGRPLKAGTAQPSGQYPPSYPRARSWMSRWWP